MVVLFWNIKYLTTKTVQRYITKKIVGTCLMHSGCNTLYLNSLEHQHLVTDLTLVYLLDHKKTI